MQWSAGFTYKKDNLLKFETFVLNPSSQGYLIFSEELKCWAVFH